ncbi:hypothetical protein Tco_1132958 [Tanacetum coccineum]|uniref:Uncharacterized protein n=1 Tax=Tanacetum coccineum TaxID=301880 RepID=A0ABQ5JG45_9ASTR
MFSNPLFDDSSSSDDESSYEEDVHEMSFKTYSNPLFDLDKEIISIELNPIHNEDLDSTPKDVRFDAESYLLESLVNRDTLNGDILFLETLLYDNSSPRPPEALQANSNAIESLPPSHIPVADNDSLKAGGDSGNFYNGLNRDTVVNMCINFLYGSDSEQRTHEFMHIYLAHAIIHSTNSPNRPLPRTLNHQTLNGKAYFLRLSQLVLEKTEHNTDFHQIVDFFEASHIRYALMVRPTVYVAHIQQFWSTARVETVDEATKIIAYGLMDRENIAKTSAMPHEASPRVTSLGGGEGSMQQQLTKLMDICTSLQRQHSLMEAKIQSQDLEITQLKTRIKTLEDNEKMREGFAQEDAPNTGGGVD